MIEWRLKEVLMSKGIANPYQLQKCLEQQLNISVSYETCNEWFHKQPQQLKLRSAQILCNFLNLPLNDFLSVVPDESKGKAKELIKPFLKDKPKHEGKVIAPNVLFE